MMTKKRPPHHTREGTRGVIRGRNPSAIIMCNGVGTRELEVPDRFLFKGGDVRSNELGNHIFGLIGRCPMRPSNVVR
jgi:hypothetical protein